MAFLDYEGLGRYNNHAYRPQNGVYEGRDLSTVFASAAALHAAVAAGNFKKIHVGDYWPITLSGTYHNYATDADATMNAVMKMEVASINPYINHGDTALTAQHILFCSRDCMPPTLQYRSENSTWYDTEAVNPWLGSHLYQTLNNADNGIITLVEATDLGAYLFAGPNSKGMRTLLPTMAAGVGSPTSWAWSNRGKLFLPEEREVYGSIVWSNASGYNAGNLYNQWDIFRGSARHIMKGAGNGGGRCYWWLESAYSATAFCYVSSYGVASHTTAANTGIRVPLCFLFT